MRILFNSRDLLRGVICLAPSLGLSEQTTQEMAWVLMIASYLSIGAELLRRPAANEPPGSNLTRTLEPAIELISTSILIKPHQLNNILVGSNKVVRIFNLNMIYQAKVFFGLQTPHFVIPLMGTLINIVSLGAKAAPLETISRLTTGIFSLGRGLHSLPETIRTMSQQSLFMASL